jgi:hypothetical protein
MRASLVVHGHYEVLFEDCALVMCPSDFLLATEDFAHASFERVLADDVIGPIDEALVRPRDEVVHGEGEVVVRESEVLMGHEDLDMTDAELVMAEGDLVVDEADFVMDGADVVKDQDDFVLGGDDLLVVQGDLAIGGNDFVGAMNERVPAMNDVVGAMNDLVPPVKDRVPAMNELVGPRHADVSCDERFVFRCDAALPFTENIMGLQITPRGVARKGNSTGGRAAVSVSRSGSGITP